MDVVDRAPTDLAPRRPAPSRPGGRVPELLTLLLGLAAVLGAVVLPLAPVEMSVPTVSWPTDPRRPASTMLELTNQQPLTLDVRFGCAAVRAAAGTADGVVLSTIVPGYPAARTDGLLVTARDGRLLVLDRGRELLDEPIRPGACSYRLSGDADRLVLERDGTAVATVEPDGRGDLLPDVDVLATGITGLPSGDLRAELAVDNQFNSTPTPLKLLLVAGVLVCAAGALVGLHRIDRGRAPPAATRPRPPGRPAGRLVGRAVDAVVVLTVLLWLFLAPLSDDDGYYAAMARNANAEGFVGNYYQLLNQSFTPFTWFYRALGWWQGLGQAPVLLRLPALVAGLATWALLRRFTTRPEALPGALAATRWGPAATAVLLGGGFLAWWLPYGMGVRPEAAVGLLALATLALVAAGLRSGRLLPVALAVGTAGLAVACHPTGFVGLAPLVVTLPRVARLVARAPTRSAVLARATALLAPGALASAAAFADGSLHDFLRGQEIFLSIQEQNSWYDEYQRYGFLLGPIPMGSYARRAAVLAGLLALGWFLVLAVAARTRGLRLPVPLLLAGQSLGAAYLLLWLTPSKWTHHFGALAGLGPVFLALFLAAAPGLVRGLTRGRPLGPAVPVLAVGSVAVVAALAMHGPNSWPYTWLPGVPHPDEPPFLGPVRLDSLLTWLAVAVVVLAAGRALRARSGRRGPLWPAAAPALVLVLLLTSVTHLVGGFGLATLRTLDGWSPWADALTDPAATGCAAAGAVDVFDVSAARPLLPVDGAPDGRSDFAEGGGWFAPNPPVAAPGTGVATYTWGSLTGPEAEDTTGEQTTPWFPLPGTGEGEEPAVLAAGRLSGANSLLVQYAVADGAAQPRIVDTEVLTDGLESPRWRTFLLDPAAARERGAGLLRLVAEDRSGGGGGWLAFTGPSVLPQVPLTRYLPESAPVATAWQVAFLFPCQRQPVVRYGITEPARYGIVWRADAAGDGLGDNTWRVERGGLFAPVQRTSAVTELAVVVRDDPAVQQIQVLRFTVPYLTEGYDLLPQRVVRLGWAGAPVT